MRRALRWLGWIVATLLGTPLLAVAALLLALNTEAGQRLAVRLVNREAGASLHLSGLSGRFPDAPRLERIELRDGAGAYAVITDAALDWSPLRLLHREAAIRRLAAAEVSVLRRPIPAAGGAAPSSGATTTLPVRVDVASLHIDRLALAAPVAGTPAVMAVEGTAHLADLHTGRAEVVLRRLDAPGRYHLAGHIDQDTLAAQVSAEEPAQGFIASVADLPGLGALSVQASLEGPWSGAAVRLAATAGPLRLDGQGRIDITGEAADLDLAATAPAMAPRPDVSWQSVALDAHVHGKLARPQARATVRIERLAAAGAAIDRLAADVAGDAGHVQLSATAEGVRVPGPKPDLLATAPLTLHADVDLTAPGRPLRFALAHPLLGLDGSAETQGALQAQAHLDLPDLAPLAEAGSVAVQGRAALDLTAAKAGETLSATLDGTVGISGGMAPLPALLGPAARIGLAASLHGSDIALTRLQLDGSTLSLAAHGGMTGGMLALDWQAALADLSAVAATVQGRLDGKGHIAGHTDDLAVQADLTGEIATAKVPRGPLRITLDVHGLPDRPTGRISAEGELDGAPLTLDATAARDADGTLHLAIGRAAWKSAHAEGGFTLAPNAALPLGRLTVGMERLDDLSRLLGQTLAGSLTANAELAQDAGRPTARLKLEARGAGLPGTATINTARLDATVRDPMTDPDVTAALDLAGLRAGSIGGDARLEASGRQAALGLRLRASVQDLAGAPLQATGAATLDVPAERIALSALEASWQGQTLRLLAPARIDFAGPVRVDRLRLGVQQAVLEVAGRVSPTLDLTAALRNVTAADLASALAPGIRAEGVLNAEARLTGTAARPEGSVHVAADGLHLPTGAAAGLPPARLTADAKLAGTSADLQMLLAAGRNRITLNGPVPIPTAAPGGAMRLRAAGTLDLATLNPLLTASGRHVLGIVSLDATVTGPLAAPRPAGTLTLAGGSVQDFALGAHLSDIAALITADGETIRITRLTARAGQGTLSAGGTLGLSGAMPVNLTLTARGAQPLTTDQLTATLDADLALRGAMAGALAASGTITVDRADFRIPDRLPTSIAVLDVRRPGQKPPPPAAPGPNVALNLTVTAPGQVFVRGRGLFAELAGRITVGGSTAAPVPVGVFRLRRGSFDLAGTSLTFTSGDIRFEGSGKLDPALNLVATSISGNIVATLTVGGFASAPKITLSSTPELPQDEILAQLLYHQSAGSLSPVQLASAAAALAQVSGMGGAVFDPLNSLRQELGLDKLTIGGGQSGTGATVEAGRYVAPGVYVGAKQAADGSGTQATVQIDLLRGLKLETDVGTGTQTNLTGAAATADPYGTSVGLTYQFQY